MEQEGVIKYQLVFEHRSISIDDTSLAELNQCRQQMMAHGLIGQDDNRYEGYGFGNLSLRCQSDSSIEAPPSFWISGTQTGHLPTLFPRDICLVNQSHPETNTIHAEGETKPSSESMTHGVIYKLSARIKAVVHVHSTEIWKQRSALKLASTPKEIPYGTPEMAESVRQLSAQLLLSEKSILFCMDGHEDGVVVAGESLSQCTQTLINTLHRAATY
ncbi:hypothetical protein A3729_25025, partial [Oleiphilus sp. HI0043]|uniref:class II aldolase/adducin family protein n=3 Tax=Oleiphilus TaxID=141450 RepID=UPI0007C3DB6D